MSDFTICIEHTILNEALKENNEEVKTLLKEMLPGELILFEQTLNRLLSQVWDAQNARGGT